MLIKDAELYRKMSEGNRLGTKDTFQFSCDRCGKCCRNREDILLNPKDLFRIAQHLDITPEEVVNQYCEQYIGDSSQMPVIRLRPKEYRKSCPFLTKDGCAIHSAKPTVCAIFPLGRTIDPVTGEVFYFTQPIDCGSSDVAHTVAEWLSEFNMEDDAPDAAAWFKALQHLALVMNKAKTKLPRNTLILLRGSLAAACYHAYDIHRPFREQFQRNINRLEALLNELGLEE